MAGGTESSAVVAPENGGSDKGIGGGALGSSVVNSMSRVRYVSTFDDGKPSLVGVIDFDPGAAGVNWTQAALRAYTAASKTWILSGTNAATANATLSARGGLTLTTAGASGDEMIVSPLIINSVRMTPLGRADWTPEYQPNFSAVVRVPDTITSLRIIAGFKLTASAERQESASGVTDNDYALFVFDTGHAVSATLWHVATGVAGTDLNTPADTRGSRKATLRAGDRVALTVKLDNNRVPYFYIDGELVGVGPEMATALALKPVFAVVALTAAARETTFQSIECSQNI